MQKTNRNIGIHRITNLVQYKIQSIITHFFYLITRFKIILTIHNDDL